MRITIVQGAFLPVPPLRGGAVEKVWLALGQEFARRGHMVTHFSRRFDGLPDREMRDGVSHRRVSGFEAPPSLLALKTLDLWYSLRVRALLPRADLLITNTFWLPCLVRGSRSGRLYVHVARFPKGQMRWYRHAGRLQTVSAAIAEAVAAEVPGLAQRVCSIPYPLSDLPAEELLPPMAARPKQILYVGRVHPEKGLEVLIDAVAGLPAAKYGEWKLVIVGPAEHASGGGGADYLQTLRERAAPLGERVEFVGGVFDPGRLRGYYLAAPVFVYPSLAERGETFGLAPLEAMAYGCAVVVSALRCFQEFVQAGSTGLVFDHRSPSPAAALDNVLRTLLENSEARAALARQGRRKAEEFTVAKIADRYLADFADLLSSPENRLDPARNVPH